MTPVPERMRDHWWWRPGWRVGRRMYTWHFTFDGQDELHRLVTAYQDRLQDLGGVDPIPLQWLHLTTQGVGFVDEVSDGEVTAVVDTVRKLLADAEPVTVQVGPAVIDPEVIRLRIDPVAALVPVRRAIRTAIAQVRGADRLMEPDEWNPHVSVAYSNADGPMAPLAAAIAEELPPVPVRIDEVQLIVLGRDEHCYTWTTRDRVSLGR